MFRTFARTFLPNRFDWMLNRCAKRGGKKILLGWNRGLGDIALGLYAMVHRIRELIPEAEITFLTRPNLREGFTLLEHTKVLVAPEWKRGQAQSVKKTLQQLQTDPKAFDLIIENPSPTDWVRWQRGKLIPRLQWDEAHDRLWERFHLPAGFTYIGVQPMGETNYALWRNWPEERWRELLKRLSFFPNVRVILLGMGREALFEGDHLIDLRGKTSLFELLSIIKNRCDLLIVPDSGILSLTYYIDQNFPLQVISLWSDPYQGVLKQAVASPNPQLFHSPLIAASRDLSSVSVSDVLAKAIPVKPLYMCPSFEDAPLGSLEKTACILLAGGQGSRLGLLGPKGMFPILGKSLFQWICERAPKENFPIAIMTSPLNHEETVAFFAQHGNFGREVFFFQQDLLPFLDEEKKPMKIRGKVIEAPSGNGAVYRAFARSGLKELFCKRGIEVVTLIPVENGLADPADLHLIGQLRASSADAVVKCIKREKRDESMGVLVSREGRIEVVEYIHLDPAISYPYSYAGMMAVSFPFFLAMGESDLPLHFVKKKVPGLEILGWKRERFIFDALPYASRAKALWYPREKSYASLKQIDSLGAVESLMSREKKGESLK